MIWAGQLVADQAPATGRMIVHSGARVAFATDDSSFDTFQVTLENDASFDVQDPSSTKRPAWTHQGGMKQVERRIGTLEQKTRLFEQKKDDIGVLLRGEVTELQGAFEVLRQSIDLLGLQNSQAQYMKMAAKVEALETSLDVLELKLDKKTEHSSGLVPKTESFSSSDPFAGQIYSENREDNSPNESGSDLFSLWQRPRERGRNAAVLELSASRFLGKREYLTITSDTILEGEGYTLVFGSTDVPVITIKTGASLTVRNCVLSRVGVRSLICEEGGQLILGEGVRIELAEDLVFSTGTITCDAQHRLPLITSLGAARTLKLQGAQWDLGQGGLILEGVTFVLSDDTAVRASFLSDGDTTEVGALVLGDQAGVLCSEMLAFPLVITTGKAFLQSSSACLTIGAPVLFTPERCASVVLRLGFERSGMLRFIGDGRIYIDSRAGDARFIFEQKDLTIVTDAPEQFFIGSTGLVRGESLTLEGAGIAAASGTFLWDVQSLREHAPLCALIPDRAYATFATGLITCNANATGLPVRYYTGNVLLRGLGSNVYFSEGVLSFAPRAGESESDETRRLMLGGNAICSFPEGMVWKEQDILYITGKNNRLVVNRSGEWAGSCVMQAGSELIIDTGAGDLVISDGASFTLNGGKISFVGGGAVLVRGGCLIDLAPSQEEQRSYGLCVVDDGVSLIVLSSGLLTVSGVGRVGVTRNGGVSLENGGQWYIGLSERDQITLLASQSGRISVGSVSGGARGAELSCGYGTFRLKVESGASLFFEKNAVWGLNVRAGVAVGGSCVQYDVTMGGSIVLAPEGRVCWAPNRFVSGAEQRCLWDVRRGVISGGQLALVSTQGGGSGYLSFPCERDERSFAGRGGMGALLTACANS